MRISKSISITLPPEMYARAEKIAEEENRTMSDLLREALRRYEFDREFRELQAYGRAQAAKTGLKEKDIVPIIKKIRKDLWAEQKKKQSADKKPRKK